MAQMRLNLFNAAVLNQMRRAGSPARPKINPLDSCFLGDPIQYRLQDISSIVVESMDAPIGIGEKEFLL